MKLSSRLLLIVASVVGLGLLAWVVAIGIGRLSDPVPEAQPVRAAPAPATPVAHIQATLFVVAPGDEYLAAVRREVPLGEGLVEQGRQIVSAQLQAPPEPYLPVFPEGTTLRGFYATERGDAFVDLSGEIAKHPGGSTRELLTVYSLVNAVTANLPTIKRVQLLVEGKEVDSLAGHVDLRRPLDPNPTLVRPDGERPATAKTN